MQAWVGACCLRRCHQVPSCTTRDITIFVVAGGRKPLPTTSKTHLTATCRPYHGCT
jgi:hypothetical protein